MTGPFGFGGGAIVDANCARRDGAIRHFWSAEMADPGQNPFWTLPDPTPEGRGTDWYPRLSY